LISQLQARSTSPFHPRRQRNESSVAPSLELGLFGELDHQVVLRLVANTTLGGGVAALQYERIRK
jgi:hypothetical protein